MGRWNGIEDKKLTSVCFCRVLFRGSAAGARAKVRGLEQQSAARGGGGSDSSGMATVGEGIDGPPRQRVGELPSQRSEGGVTTSLR